MGVWAWPHTQHGRRSTLRYCPAAYSNPCRTGNFPGRGVECSLSVCEGRSIGRATPHYTVPPRDSFMDANTVTNAQPRLEKYFLRSSASFYQLCMQRPLAHLSFQSRDFLVMFCARVLEDIGVGKCSESMTQYGKSHKSSIISFLWNSCSSGQHMLSKNSQKL